MKQCILILGLLSKYTVGSEVEGEVKIHRIWFVFIDDIDGMVICLIFLGISLAKSHLSLHKKAMFVRKCSTLIPERTISLAK